uniref:uncharacterized protein LOC120959205 isoform X2 n=1 Tax=Anopheles coluzzii TaxID=1518534 RepID=UPI0020FFE898|nr:uncharacterized protein LOC120959205 isoform X2 [Anopheles coluzzii]
MEDKQCGVCNGASTENAVECDRCEGMFHLACVNEDETVYSRDWTCHLCTPETPPPASSTLHRATPVVATQPAPVAVDTNIVNLEPSTRARSTEVITPVSNPPNDPSKARPTQTADSPLDNLSRTFQRFLEEAREPRRQEPDVIQRLESVLNTFVQRMNQEQNPQGSRRDNLGSTASCSSDTTLNINQSQILARHSVNAQLPTFAGNPEEWSVFENAFYETTELCGFSDGENIIRLQQALKGEAFKTVQGRLRKAANLKEVMQELKSSFGRPEVVVKTLLSQIRRQVPPRAEKLETLVQFAVSVDEMCAAVRNNGVEERYDGLVLDELVGRLPPMIKLMWGIHSLTLSKVNLAAF